MYNLLSYGFIKMETKKCIVKVFITYLAVLDTTEQTFQVLFLSIVYIYISCW